MWSTAAVKLLVLVQVLGLTSGYRDTNQLLSSVHEVFSWSQVDFAYPSPQMRQNALWSGMFDPRSVVPIGVAAAGHRIFLSMPRWRSGIPAALATITLPANSSAPLLHPYPSWAWHRPGDCKGITSVFRVKVDECGRLWVLDTGLVNTFVKAEQICPPQVHVFDLTTDKLLFRYRFPEDVLKHESLLVSIEVEYPTSHCGGALGPAGAVIYVADTTTFGLIVADLKVRGDESAWRVQDKTLYPSPEAGTFTVSHESFELMDGVLGLALSPRSTKGDRILFYHAMSSFRQRWVRTSVLHNATDALHNPRAFKSSAHTRASQVAGCTMDQHGVMFFGLLANNALACWNTHKPFTPHNVAILAQDDQKMQFITTTTVDNEGRVWALSTRFQSYILETLDHNDLNFRVFMAPSSDVLVRGTACERGAGLVHAHVNVHHHHHLHHLDNRENLLSFHP